MTDSRKAIQQVVENYFELTEGHSKSMSDALNAIAEKFDVEIVNKEGKQILLTARFLLRCGFVEISIEQLKRYPSYNNVVTSEGDTILIEQEFSRQRFCVAFKKIGPENFIDVHVTPDVGGVSVKIPHGIGELSAFRFSKIYESIRDRPLQVTEVMRQK